MEGSNTPILRHCPRRQLGWGRRHRCWPGALPLLEPAPAQPAKQAQHHRGGEHAGKKLFIFDTPFFS